MRPLPGDMTEFPGALPDVCFAVGAASEDCGRAELLEITPGGAVSDAHCGSLQLGDSRLIPLDSLRGCDP